MNDYERKGDRQVSELNNNINNNEGAIEFSRQSRQRVVIIQSVLCEDNLRVKRTVLV